MEKTASARTGRGLKWKRIKSLYTNGVEKGTFEARFVKTASNCYNLPRPHHWLLLAGMRSTPSSAFPNAYMHVMRSVSKLSQLGKRLWSALPENSPSEGLWIEFVFVSSACAQGMRLRNRLKYSLQVHRIWRGSEMKSGLSQFSWTPSEFFAGFCEHSRTKNRSWTTETMLQKEP